ELASDPDEAEAGESEDGKREEQDQRSDREQRRTSDRTADLPRRAGVQSGAAGLDEEDEEERDHQNDERQRRVERPDGDDASRRRGRDEQRDDADDADREADRSSDPALDVFGRHARDATRGLLACLPCAVAEHLVLVLLEGTLSAAPQRGDG